MSQFSRQHQPTPGQDNRDSSSQGFETIPSNTIHPNLNLFSSTNTDLLTDDEDEEPEEEKRHTVSSGQSLSQVSQSSNESTGSSSSMEINEKQCPHRPHLAIIIPNFFRSQHGGQQQQAQGIHERTNINSTSSGSSSSSGDGVIILESRSVQTDLDLTDQQEGEEEDQEEDQEEDDNDAHFFDAGQNQRSFYKPFSQI